MRSTHSAFAIEVMSTPAVDYATGISFSYAFQTSLNLPTQSLQGRRSKVIFIMHSTISDYIHINISTYLLNVLADQKFFFPFNIQALKSL